MPPSREHGVPPLQIVIVFVGDDILQLSPADAAVFFWRLVEPAPTYQPDEAQKSRYHECRTPTPAEVDRENDERGNRATDGRAAIQERCGKSALLLREPL